MARIVSVYHAASEGIVLRDMSCIRWLKIAEALARAGHEVDIATNEAGWRTDPTLVALAPNLRRVPLAAVRWTDYDVVKTVFHGGFETLEKYGGAGHPFIVSKLGSVVGPRDMAGVYFYGAMRAGLWATQEKIHRASRYVTVLSPQAEALWRECHGPRGGFVLVPGGVDANIPPAPAESPFPNDSARKCLFAGNVYTLDYQGEANRVLTGKLNDLGRLLAADGIRVYFLGNGDLDRLNSRYVTNLGNVLYERSWDYFRHADAGIVVSAGPFMHNNESSKIYHYLRAGLPVVSEEGFPNDHVVRESGLGFVASNGDMGRMAELIREAVAARWDRERAVGYVLARHTWDVRVRAYQGVLP